MKRFVKSIALVFMLAASGIAAEWGDLSLRIVYDSDTLPVRCCRSYSLGDPYATLFTSIACFRSPKLFFGRS